MNVIKIENLGKKYIIGHQRHERYLTLRDSLAHTMRGIGQRIRHPLLPNREEIDLEEFWALKNINFEVKQGERIGIIGPNGAGKTTLLKILSRITDPSEGRIRIGGRVASLLEVGTGFHPELTGRENIFLNGAVLGMHSSEIKRKFDEIVAFAEMEQFLDTPVKRYSSGMYVRLAFAVAAHLEPEILLVDEVLAVGDISFQRRCLGKMNDVAREGRTVVFVSHNMAAIQKLCSRVILLERGNIIMDDSPEGAVNMYLKNIYNKTITAANFENVPRVKKSHGTRLRVMNAWVLNNDGEKTQVLKMGEPFSVCMEAKYLDNLDNVSAVVGIDDNLGNKITTVASEEANVFYSGRKGESLHIKVNFSNLILNTGQYVVRIGARSGGVVALDYIPSAYSFEVMQTRHDDSVNFLDLSGMIKVKPLWNSDKV